MGTRLVIPGIVLVALVAAPSMADTTWLRDPDDTDGKLDIKSVVQAHEMDSPVGEAIRHRLTMFRYWNKKALRSRNNFINLFFDTDDDKGFDRRLNIDVRNGALRAKMEKWPGLEDVGFAKVWRPNGRSVSVAFSESWLGRRVGAYQWIGYSVYTVQAEASCGFQGDQFFRCTDRLPNKGRYTHER